MPPYPSSDPVRPSEAQPIPRSAPPDRALVAKEGLVCKPKIHSSGKAAEAPEQAGSSQARLHQRTEFFQLMAWLVSARSYSIRAAWRE